MEAIEYFVIWTEMGPPDRRNWTEAGFLKVHTHVINVVIRQTRVCYRCFQAEKCAPEVTSMKLWEGELLVQLRITDDAQYIRSSTFLADLVIYHAIAVGESEFDACARDMECFVYGNKILDKR